eukprot:4183615-Pyramimonas_sp.AAC.1
MSTIGRERRVPKHVLRTVCGLHDMFLEHVWLRWSCFSTSGSCSKKGALFCEHFWGLRTFRGRPTGMPGRSVPARRGEQRLVRWQVMGAGSTLSILS